MNEVFLDTETTGLSFRDGHKVIEIACIETKDLIATGKVFHKLINPKRSVPEEAFKIHGFSQEFLSDKETFDQVADEFLSFIKNNKVAISQETLNIEANSTDAKGVSTALELQIANFDMGIDAGDGIRYLITASDSSENIDVV